MLKLRILSGVIGVAILLTVAWFGQLVLGIAIFIVSLIGLYEFYNSVSNKGFNPIRSIGYLSSTYILIIGLNDKYKFLNNFSDLFNSVHYLLLAIFLLLVVLFSFSIFLHKKYNISDVALTIFGIIYVVFLFSFVLLTRNLENGLIFMWLIFIGAFSTDTFAFIFGSLFGKNKILPEISKHKTIEGSIGGVFGSILITVIYWGYLRYSGSFTSIAITHFIIIGFLNGIISQIGDWSASSIKRYVNVKDYGIIIPGHGGVLDRFDSILFCAPVVYFYVIFLL